MGKYMDGQKVIISKILSEPNRHPDTTPEMNKYRGKIVTISHPNSCGCCYRINEDSGCWAWAERWLKPIGSKKFFENCGTIIQMEGSCVTLLFKNKDGKEEKEKTVSLSNLFEKIIKECPNKTKDENISLAQGTKFYQKSRGIELVVVEQAPQIREINVNGKMYKLSFPYVEFVFVFKDKKLMKSFLFYRTQPIHSLGDELLLPNLPNVFANNGACEINWAKNFPKIITESFSVINVASNLSNDFWKSNFLDSKKIKTTFVLSKKIDNRIKTIQDWEEASAENPLFVFDIKWLSTELSIKNLIKDNLNKDFSLSHNTVSDLLNLINQ